MNMSPEFHVSNTYVNSFVYQYCFIPKRTAISCILKIHWCLTLLAMALLLAPFAFLTLLFYFQADYEAHRRPRSRTPVRLALV